MAWILRFLSRSRKRLQDPEPTLEESINANGKETTPERKIFKRIRIPSTQPIDSSKGKVSTPFSNLGRKRTTYPNQRQCRTSSEESKHRAPYFPTCELLPIVVSLLIIDKHESLAHAGVKTTLSELKEKLWVVKGRQQVKKVWFACVPCQKLTTPPFQEIASPLPLNGLHQAQAFQIMRVDFAGPLFYKPAPAKRIKRDNNPQVNPDP
ncbi:uncharacterized protein LOC123477434 [Daphnia magna]|uniref:uncharacterized protein LOC123477434 n=1 Tax=Daphnia magna TaxID=35525 RepID=UPI001E1BC7DE|nr:uncharacterized protein LOC123477434 [Daphnia magna]